MNFNKRFTIGSVPVGTDEPTFVIAEAGVNHNGDVGLAKQLIDVAATAGASAVKFQSFTAELLNTANAPKSSYHIRTTPRDEKESWLDLLRSQELSLASHRALIEYCREKNILFLSTPYDVKSADMLGSLGVPAFKIASTDANNYPFLNHIAGKKKPIILSTGMCDLEEVRQALEIFSAAGTGDVIVLHCTTDYPCALANSNLLAMKTMEQEFGVTVGYSDHCLSRIGTIAAVALGAKIIEKHFTLSRDLKGPDHQASLLPEELAQAVRDIRETESALGEGVKIPLQCEIENRTKLRKSIVAAHDLSRGTVLTGNMLTCKRPGTGLAPGEMRNLLGKRLVIDIKKDQQLSYEYFESG